MTKQIRNRLRMHKPACGRSKLMDTTLAVAMASLLVGILQVALQLKPVQEIAEELYRAAVTMARGSGSIPKTESATKIAKAEPLPDPPRLCLSWGVPVLASRNFSELAAVTEIYQWRNLHGLADLPVYLSPPLARDHATLQQVLAGVFPTESEAEKLCEKIRQTAKDKGLENRRSWCEPRLGHPVVCSS